MKSRAIVRRMTGCLGILAGSITLWAWMGAASSMVVAEEIDFNRDVRPILSENCFHCHGPDSETREANLRLDIPPGGGTDGESIAVIVPGTPDSSEMIARIEDQDDPMPPRGSTRNLSSDEKRLLRIWVEQGAEYATHWSFDTPMRPDVPLVATGTKNPIDAFIARRHRELGLEFSREAPPRKLIRRVTLDLTGIPPTPSEVDEFVREYRLSGEHAYQRLINRLIQSPRYGETMALPWLDAARFADTDGYQYDGPRYQWRWRDWVIDAYNSNMPFDQFTVEQLAGDLLPEPTMEQRVATAFNRNHRYNSEAGLVVDEFLLENAVDRVDTTSTLWMGLTMGCARCHDHKFDPISQKDYYQLIAFFNSVPEAGRAVKSGNSEPVVYAPTDDQKTRLLRLQEAVAEARARVRPGKVIQRQLPLINRRLAHFFKLDAIPTQDAKARGEVEFNDQSAVFDGQSSLELSALKKSLTFKANQRFTIAFWIKPKRSTNGVVLSRQNTGTTRPGVELSLLDDGRLQFDLVTRWVAGVGRVTTTEPIPHGRWSHVVVTSDGSHSANGQRIYINARLAPSRTGHNTNSNVGGVKADRPLILGVSEKPDATHFTGSLRHLAIYETELWPEEIEILAATEDDPKRVAFSRAKMTKAYGQYIAAREALEDYQRTLPTVMVMQESAVPKPTFVRVRGVYNKLGGRVDREVPGIFPPMDYQYPRNRLGLAQWLVSGQHPLTARVAVNRYWQKYFGNGLVRSPEDFGTQGGLPSHPDLLDWLAVEFVSMGWDIAAMQKLIVTSRTYRQESDASANQIQSDPSNRWLARAPRLRLSAHSIRDQSLFVSELLSERIGGPSVSPYQSEGLWAEMSMGMKYRQSKGSDLFRRSLYTIWKRTVAPPTMAVFDAADRESCWVRRKQTNTPLQALTLLNEATFIESARHLAVRMLDHEDPIGFGYQVVVSRDLLPFERNELQAALKRYQSHFDRSPKAARDLIAIGESPISDRYPSETIAAYTMLANVLLNLDETITRE